MIIEEVWNILEMESEKISFSGELIRRIYPQSKYDFFLGFERPMNLKFFVFKTGILISQEKIQFRNSKGMELYIKNNDEIHIKLVDNKFNEFFVILINDLISCLLNSNISKQESVSLFINRLDAWRVFMHQFNLEGLDEQRQKGLFGELNFIKNVLLPASIKSWRGPEAADHDFQNNKCAVEVKTTSSKKPQKLIINSEKQLDNTSVKQLYICHISVDKGTSIGQTLNDLIRDIREKLGYSQEYFLFEEKLIKVGYLNKYSFLYDAIYYNVREINIYSVQNNFPKIVSKDLPKGIGDIKYSILVDSIKDFKISLSSVKDKMSLYDYEE